MKKIAFIWALFFALVCGVANADAASFGGITINSWTIQSISPTSFSSVDGSVRLNVNNTRGRIMISDISGIIYNKAGEMFIIGRADDLTIPRGVSDISVVGHCSLPSFTVLLTLLNNFSVNPADYTADIRANVKVGWGHTHLVEMKGVPLSTFLQ